MTQLYSRHVPFSLSRYMNGDKLEPGKGLFLGLPEPFRSWLLLVTPHGVVTGVI